MKTSYLIQLSIILFSLSMGSACKSGSSSKSESTPGEVQNNQPIASKLETYLTQLKTEEEKIATLEKELETEKHKVDQFHLDVKQLNPKQFETFSLNITESILPKYRNLSKSVLDIARKSNLSNDRQVSIMEEADSLPGNEWDSFYKQYSQLIKRTDKLWHASINETKRLNLGMDELNKKQKLAEEEILK